MKASQPCKCRNKAVRFIRVYGMNVVCLIVTLAIVAGGLYATTLSKAGAAEQTPPPIVKMSDDNPVVLEPTIPETSPVRYVKMVNRQPKVFFPVGGMVTYNTSDAEAINACNDIAAKFKEKSPSLGFIVNTAVGGSQYNFAKFEVTEGLGTTTFEVKELLNEDDTYAGIEVARSIAVGGPPSKSTVTYDASGRVAAFILDGNVCLDEGARKKNGLAILRDCLATITKLENGTDKKDVAGK